MLLGQMSIRLQRLVIVALEHLEAEVVFLLFTSQMSRHI
jgi:hypothetical protein